MSHSGAEGTCGRIVETEFEGDRMFVELYLLALDDSNRSAGCASSAMATFHGGQCVGSAFTSVDETIESEDEACADDS